MFGVIPPPKQEHRNPPNNWYLSPYPVAPLPEDSQKPSKRPVFRIPPREYQQPWNPHINVPDDTDYSLPGFPITRHPIGNFQNLLPDIYSMYKRKRRPITRIHKRRRLGGRTFRGSTITKYRNTGLVYNRRPMPKRRRRRYVKRISFVKKVINRTLGARTLIYSTGGLCTATAVTAANSQGVIACFLYGSNGGTALTSGNFCSVGDPDLFNIYSKEAPNINQTALFNIGGAVLDIQIGNPSANSPVFVDVYKVICRRDVALSGAAVNFSGLLNREFSQQVPITGGPYTPLAPNNWPATLFDCSGICRYFKILNKVRTQLDPGAVVQMQLRSHRMKRFCLEDLESKLYLRGWTIGYVFFFWGTPLAAGGNQPSAASISFLASRRYRVTFDSGNVVAAGEATL